MDMSCMEGDGKKMDEAFCESHFIVSDLEINESYADIV
jgi:hypothetical protein